jgi:hypothetical protein
MGRVGGRVHPKLVKVGQGRRDGQESGEKSLLSVITSVPFWSFFLVVYTSTQITTFWASSM